MIQRTLSVCCLIGAAACFPRLSPANGEVAAAERPNIVWLIVEDMSADMACYGQKDIETPRIDQLAAEGVRFTRAFVTGPICSIARSSLITGMYQTSIGAHHHRSGRGTLKIHLPNHIRPVPELFREAGYLCNNLTVEDFIRDDAALARNSQIPVAKTDYNFEWNTSLYDTTHWKARPSEQPFFVQVQLRGGKLRGKGDGERWPQRVAEALGRRTAPGDVHLPPYLPDDPVIREDWAQYLDTVRYTDWEVGRIVDRLKEAGELERTVLFFITDHGVSHVRNKQFLYDGGIHIPLIIRGPGLRAGDVRDDLVLHIDLAAASLALAGIPLPESMQARNILAADYQPRKFVVSARDRADETVEHMRSVRTERYKYIRNYFPSRPYLQPNAYKDGKPILQAMRRLHAAGALTPEQSLIMAESKPREELYDLEQDPWEFKNLAGDPQAREILETLRSRLDEWVVESGDLGRAPESEAMYDSDMKVYVRNGNPIVERNISLMKKWAVERPHVE